MYIKKLTNSNVLKRGELLIALKRLWLYRDDAYIDLRQGKKTGVVQFYRHRQGPVPWVSRWENGRCFRRPRTTNERRANCAVNTLTEVLENHGLAFKVRPKRSSHRLPTVYDDIFLRRQRSWKEYRRTQQKVVGSVNRRIHSPPIWVEETPYGDLNRLLGLRLWEDVEESQLEASRTGAPSRLPRRG
jgi:hypothetical protein